MKKTLLENDRSNSGNWKTPVSICRRRWLVRCWDTCGSRLDANKPISWWTATWQVDKNARQCVEEAAKLLTDNDLRLVNYRRPLLTNVSHPHHWYHRHHHIIITSSSSSATTATRWFDLDPSFRSEEPRQVKVVVETSPRTHRGFLESAMRSEIRP